MAKFKKDISNEPIHSIIGENAHFHGEFTMQGSLRIDGEFSGKIVSEGKILVGPTGHVKTNIQALRVIVAGKVEGNIVALESVHLLSSAQVSGDIISANLIIDDGVAFEGRVKINHWKSADDFFALER